MWVGSEFRVIPYLWRGLGVIAGSWRYRIDTLPEKFSDFCSFVIGRCKIRLPLNE